jgi:hypothetical protein
MHPGEMNIDPIEAEFFTTEALGTLADALVREVIQNSLDARLPGTPLKIRIASPPPEAWLEGERRARYVGALWPHLEAPGAGLAQLPPADAPMPSLVIEDFGTRGLQGDPRQSEDEEIEGQETRNDFYYFWRNVGRSRKHAAELGRWGLGKTVFQAASRINAFQAITVRADDRRRLLMGQSVLRIHKRGGQRFYPYGYFGRFEGDFALPVDDPAALDQFCRDFRIARAGEPGLSVVIPYPDAELTPEALVSSVIRHHFVPIIGGDLSVELVQDERTRRLDADSLERFLDDDAGADGARLRKLVALARRAADLTDAEYVRVNAPEEGSAPRWTDGCVDERDLVKLRERFNAGQPVALRVPVWVKPAAGDRVLSGFDVHLERDAQLGATDEQFVRDGITVTGVRASMPKGMRALVLARERSLSALLGDSENPAHTEWQERSPKFRDRYRHGATTLRYVKNAPREIVRLLTRPSTGRDFELLQHLFSLEIPTATPLATPEPDREAHAGAGDTGVPEGIETAGRDRFFHLQKLKGGFRIAGAGNGADMPRQAAVQVAYEVRRGNPFLQYQLPDFELDKAPITLEARHLELARQLGNLLVFNIAKSDFELTVKGFDPRRDLRVRVQPVEPEIAL